MRTTLILRTGMVMMAIGLFIARPLCGYAQEIIEIQVSPHVLNLQNNGEVVTVHTDIAYSLVVGETVFMNGIAIDSWKADDRGNFVAKFIMEEIVGLPLEIGEYNTLTLEGTKTDGTTFTGSEEVMIINIIPKKKN